MDSPTSLLGRSVPLEDAQLLRNALAVPVMEWAEWSDGLDRALSWMETLHRQIAAGKDVHASMEALHRGLVLLRRKWDREEWRRFCLEGARQHPLLKVLHTCPFTRHGFERPRGYAGDAGLIDYLYTEHDGHDLRYPGQLVYRFMYDQPSPRSVRERRRILARALDAVAGRVKDARVLSVACGHLREAESSRAVAEHRLGELIAFDQDELSLAEVQRQHPTGPVRTVQGSVRSLLQGRANFSDMDLVYSAGLYDYLAEASARRLTGYLFDMLRPGGRLILANFAHCPEVGYMEAFMDWWLVYRDEAQMQGMLRGIDPKEIASQQMFRDSENCVIYMVITRR